MSRLGMAVALVLALLLGACDAQQAKRERDEKVAALQRQGNEARAQMATAEDQQIRNCAKAPAAMALGLLWEAAVREAPWNPRAHNNLGFAYYQAGRKADAWREMHSALAFDPDFAKARANLALLDWD